MPYPHPQFRNTIMQMGYERSPPQVDNVAQEASYFHNNHPIYRQSDDYNYADAYDNMLQFKSEGSCRYSSGLYEAHHHAVVTGDCDNLDKTQLSANCVPPPSMKFEHLSEMSARKCTYNPSSSDSVGDTLKQCTTEISNPSCNDTDDSPALRALLTKPPKGKPIFAYNEEPKAEAECNYLPQINNVKSNPSEFVGVSKTISPILNSKDYNSEEKELQHSHTSNNYYPWMKTQGKLLFIETSWPFELCVMFLLIPLNKRS